jgi:alpha-tubulin suppressor-like RCC1 family protein
MNFYGASNVTLTNGYNKVTKSFGSPVIEVTNTSRGNLVLLQNGDVWSFGYNQYGELGTTLSATTTSPVGSGAGVKLSFAGIGTNTIIFIASGLHHTIFVTSAGTVYSCGLNNYGQLGQGNTTNLTTPTAITVLSNIKNCCCGLYSSYFLDNTGIVTCCGYNFNNELGNNWKVLGTSTVQAFQHYYLTPVQFNGTNKIIASGFNHSPTIISTGLIYSSGLNTNGQLGLNNTNVSFAYQILTNNPTFAQLFAGENRSASLTSSGSLFTWGKGIATKPILTDVNVTTVYQVSDIGIIYIKNNKYLGSALILTLVFAILSWFLIEKRALNYKKGYKVKNNLQEI